MQHILPFDGPIADFMRQHYDALHHEFFEHAFKGETLQKANHVRMANGRMLYEGKIDVVALKITKRLLDSLELQEVGWTDDSLYKYPFRFYRPDDAAKMTTWNDMLIKFEDSIEQIFFNIAYPNASIDQHYGVSSHCWRAHVCFQENPGFKFSIEGEETRWFKGMDHSFKFDDGEKLHGISYDEMGVEQPRITCIIDYRK